MAHDDTPRDPVTTALGRLQANLRHPLVADTQDRRTLTEIGLQVLQLARRQLDERRRLETTTAAPPVRLGVGSVFIDRFTQVGEFDTSRVTLSSAICFEVAEAFAKGELDVAYVIDVRDNRAKLAPHIVAEHQVDLAWVKATDAELDATQPLPLAVYPGDKPAMRALEAAGRDFRVMFSSPEYLSKLSAVKSGKYITAMPRRHIAPPFVEIHDDRLPPVPPTAVLTAVRGDGSSEQLRPILSVLAHLHV